MNTPTPLTEQGRPDISGFTTPVLVGRRAVLSGVLGISAGAAFGLPAVSAASKPTAGAKIYSYGHSYTRSPNPYVTRRSYDEYQLQLGRRLRSGQVTSRGVSGTRLLDTVSAIIAPTFAGSACRRWRIGDRGIVLLHSMMDDVSNARDGGHPDYLNAYEKALRLALGAFGARSFIPADRASRIGRGWSLKSSDRLDGGRSWSTKSRTDKIDFLVTGGDTVHVSTPSDHPCAKALCALNAMA